MDGTRGDFEKIVAIVKKNRGAIRTVLGITLVAGLVLAAGVAVYRAWDHPRLEEENKALRESMSELEVQLEEAREREESRTQELEKAQEELEVTKNEKDLLKESTNALKEQVSGLEAEKEDLNNRLEELLNVQESVPVITRQLLDEKLTSLSELLTKKYWYRNATSKEDAKKWLWGVDMPFSDIKFVALYDGYITAGIDLKEVKVLSVDQRTKKITVQMPKSQIFDHNIPQETINVVEVKDNLFNSVTFSDYNRFISGEKTAMEETAIGQGILEEADKEAQRVISAFLKTLPGAEEYQVIFK